MLIWIVQELCTQCMPNCLYVTDAMVGDVNLFLNEEGIKTTAEIEIMIAGDGLCCLFFKYVLYPCVT